jgi:hypothetical protein
MKKKTKTILINNKTTINKEWLEIIIFLKKSKIQIHVK